MGWGAGSGLCEDLWKRVRPFVPKNRRGELARFFVDEFENLDADDFADTDQVMKDATLPVNPEDDGC